LCSLAYEHSVCQMVSRILTRELCTFLKNLSKDTDVTQLKFISQLVIRDETCIHNFDSESEQQNMQWNERISQNCHFITLCNSVFPCQMQTTDDRQNAQNIYISKVILCMSCSEPCYYKKHILL